MKSRLSSGNACYSSFQELCLSVPCVINRQLTIGLFSTTIVLPVGLYSCETFYLTWRKDCIFLRVFDNGGA